MAATHDGHRKRMRERFRISGLEGFSEHEVLELILFYGRARGNVNDTAHALMDVFGSLPRVLEASPEQLMLIDGIGEESATLLSLILPLFRRYSDEVNQVRSKLESRQVTLDYCRTMMAGYRREQFLCHLLDGRWQHYLQSQGDGGHAFSGDGVPALGAGSRIEQQRAQRCIVP